MTERSQESILRRLRDRVGGGSGEPRAEPDGGSTLETGDSLARRYDPDLDALDEVYGGTEPAAVGDRHVRDLFEVEGDAVDELVGEYRAAGVDARSFGESQRVVTDALVDAVFDRLRADLDGDAATAVDEAREELRDGLDRATDVFAAGAGAYERRAADGADGADATESGSDPSPAPGADSLDYHDVLHHVGTPLFVLDAEGEILTWNAQLERLTGVPEAEAQAMEMASMAFYPDGRRGKTLADKVIDAPERTDEVYDVPRVEDASFTLYRDTSVMQDQHGEEVHISFSAAPIYEDGELIAVVEMVQDRTADVLRHERTSDLVGELEATMRAIQTGDLDARASFDNAEGHVDASLLNVVDELNEMASTLADLIERVDDNAGNLAAATDESAAAADEIESAVTEQNRILAEAAEDVQNVSATMEEIAATSNQVAAAADRARDSVEAGERAGETAKTVTSELTDTSDDLVDNVTELEDRMDEVNEVIEIIADVAEQTNMLALNANIEAARAGESGEGFAVVADEVKTLASETSEYADEISRTVTEVQSQANETVDSVRASSAQIREAEQGIAEALDALDDIADAVDETADGIEEVADANDSQADAIEGVTTTIEEARSHAEDAEAAARRIVETTDSQTRSVRELVDSVDRLHDTDRR
ncbi:methyl-accepting chemotaxis protein [Halosimplex pelagicum]|uniref:PAS domain-containing protein n=1 Tax=Halosimplex pelagicum TaxID=869886 RepID=A0A7D5TC51_9EURY|nr:methyl-accepting chemotaxis protein [Halosimplex pelagicum]QLH82753.1 PAS domain-containing protein [Halosimplex pelagicum]